DAQDAVPVRRLCLLHVHGSRQRHVAPEGPVRALDRAIAVTLELALDALLALNAQGVIDDLDVEIRAAHSGRLQPYDDAVLAVDHVGRHEAPAAERRELVVS